jgi:hypothetical protein
LDGIQKLNNGFLQAAPTATWGTQQVRRDFGWSAGEPSNAQDFGDADVGQCEGSTPYFYSVGPDGETGYDNRTGSDLDPDNVYTRKPKTPNGRRTAGS